MAIRISPTSLFAVVLLLGLSHACYYGYYQEPPADFEYRRCQVGCNQEDGLMLARDQATFNACCLPLAPGAFPPAQCTDLAKAGEAKGTSCAWKPVATSDMPSSFSQPPPRPTVPPACVTNWVTETAAPNCPIATQPVVEPSAVASKINAIPASSVDSVPAPGPTTAPAPVTTTVPAPVITTAPPAHVTSAPPADNTNTCACPKDGALPEKKRDGHGANTCACVAAAPTAAITAQNPSNTCACPKDGSLPERGMRRSGGENTCACTAQVTSSLVAPCSCPSATGKDGALPEQRRGLDARGGGCDCANVQAPASLPVIPVPTSGGFDGSAPPRKRAMPDPDFVPDTEGDSPPQPPPGQASLIKSGATSSVGGPIVPQSPQPTSAPAAAPACTTTMTTTITPACERGTASLINGVPATATVTAHDPEETDCEDEEDEDDGDGALPE